MNFLLNTLKTNFLSIISIIISVLIIGYICFFKPNNLDKEENVVASSTIEEKSEINNDNSVTYKIDIKGAVKNPGVYELKKNSVINDAINISGGLTNKAYTNNINLSKKIEDEMVIYIYTKSEYNAKLNKDLNKDLCQTNSYQIDSCLDSNSSIVTYNENKSNGVKDNSNEAPQETTKDNKVSINTATIDELTTLDGIGESKAQKIIEYRNTNGNFKSIDEIKNISGIGDTIFEKIKDYITI